jgi:cytochrome c2
MRNQPETRHEYNIPRLHYWFLGSSLLLLGCLALMVWVDYSGGEIRWLGLKGDRQWKNYQREFLELEKKRLLSDAQAAEMRANESGLKKTEEQLLQATKDLESKRDEEAKVRAELDKVKVRAFLVNREFTEEKATRDEVRSFYEAALARKQMNSQDPEVQDWLSKVTNQNRLVADLELKKQAADADLAAAEQKLAGIVGEKENLERSIKRLTASRDLLTNRYKELSSKLIQTVVNAPVAEFAAASIRVQQIEVENHHVNVNFATVPRVDRCITCHISIDRKDATPEERAFREKHKIENVEWSKLEQPLTSHPKLDLFVGDESPHPKSKFGCTVCHWGWDRETDFSRAGHTPNFEHKKPHVFDERKKHWVPVASHDDEEDEKPAAKGAVVEMTQKAAWIKNHNWKHQEFLLQPMRESKYTEASCLKCHSSETHLRGGENLDHGRRLIEQVGCWSCHKMQQLETYSVHRVAAGETLEGISKLYDVNESDVRAVNSLSRDAKVTVGQELNIPLRMLRKTGPGLKKIAGKTDKTWTRKWLEDPVAFRQNTYMPKFWGLDNNNDPDRDHVEINAVTEFLFAVSEPATYPAPPVKGNAEHGKELVNQLGCMACHVVEEKLTTMKVPASLRAYLDNAQYQRARSQGPQLAGTGSKTTVNWLYAWLKNPKDYHAGTKMPDLRLSDQEAADVAEYLDGLLHEATEKKSLPEVKAHKLDEVTLEYLQVTLPAKQAAEKMNNLDDLIEQYFADQETQTYYADPARWAREMEKQKALQKEFEETFDEAIERKAKELGEQIANVQKRMSAAKARVAAMTAEEKKNVFLGSKLISRYGCYACHDIAGFETAKPIGTELSEWGSKALNKLDFGLLHIEHDRVAWLKQKLRAPRSYDIGRIGVTRSPQEHLKMPKFNLTEEQIDQIVTVVSGMTDEKIRPNEPRQLSPSEFMIERGRWIAKELNCIGCHQLEGKGWAIRATGIPAGMEPPMLSGKPTQLRQGQRTNPEWLFGFLKAPETGQVRPWLKARMPTYGLTDAEANVLVKYFAYEGRTQFPYKTPEVNRSPEHLAAGKQLFEQLKCALCHIVEGRALGKPLSEIPEEDLPRLAPNLSLTAKRLQRDWLIEKWLPDPLNVVPGTRMPQFEYGTAIAPHVLGGDSLKQRQALVDYVISLGESAPAHAGK